MDTIASANRVRVSNEDATLVIVDVQEKLLPAIAEKEAMLDNITRLMRFAPEMQIPTIVVRQAKLGDVVPEIRDLSLRSAEVEKAQFDCLLCTDFAKSLRGLGRTTLLLCGIETHICVMQTGLHALTDGYHVQVVADATSSRKRINWEIGLQRMRSAGVVVTSVETLIYELLGKAGTDLFRRVLPIVK